MKKDRKRTKKEKKVIAGLSLCTKSIRITVVAWRHGKLGSRLTSFRPFRNTATNEIDKDFSLPLSLSGTSFSGPFCLHTTRKHTEHEIAPPVEKKENNEICGCRRINECPAVTTCNFLFYFFFIFTNIWPFGLIMCYTDTDAGRRPDAKQLGQPPFQKGSNHARIRGRRE